MTAPPPEAGKAAPPSLPGLLEGPCRLEEAEAACERLARAHYENFTVVSAFFPRAKRQDMYNVYAFCRYSDDLGDEDVGQGPDRAAALDRWDEEIERMVAGEPRHPILVALRGTARRYGIPAKPLHDLVHAFRLDQTRTRWETWDDLRFYCRHSADPVGRLVLYVFERASEETFALSDCTCTALQLANFWQDVAVDRAKGRVYIPQEDLRRFGYAEEDLAASVVDERWRALLRFECARARELFDRGLALLPLVPRELRIDLELFSRGGMAILGAIERQGYDVFRRRPTLSKAKKVWLVLRAFLKLKLKVGAGA